MWCRYEQDSDVLSCTKTRHLCHTTSEPLRTGAGHRSRIHFSVTTQASLYNHEANPDNQTLSPILYSVEL